MSRGLVRAVLVASLLGASAWAWAGPTVQADSAVVGSGSSFTVDIRIAGAVDLVGWQFNLAFDATRLQVDAVTEGPFLSSAGQTLFGPGVVDNGSGLLSLVNASFVDLLPPSGDGVIAHIAFTALADGLSALTLSDVFVNFLDTDITIANGAVCVGGASLTDCDAPPPTVPEPGTLALATLAAGAAALRRWRRPGSRGGHAGMAAPVNPNRAR